MSESTLKLHTRNLEIRMGGASKSKLRLNVVSFFFIVVAYKKIANIYLF